MPSSRGLRLCTTATRSLHRTPGVAIHHSEYNLTLILVISLADRSAPRDTVISLVACCDRTQAKWEDWKPAQAAGKEDELQAFSGEMAASSRDGALAYSDVPSRCTNLCRHQGFVGHHDSRWGLGIRWQSLHWPLVKRTTAARVTKRKTHYSMCSVLGSCILSQSCSHSVRDSLGGQSCSDGVALLSDSLARLLTPI